MKRRRSFPDKTWLFSSLLFLMVAAAIWNHAWAAYMFGPFGYHTPDVRAKNIHLVQFHCPG